MYIYKRNGVGYALHQTITTNEPLLVDFFASADLSELSFGGKSKYVSTYYVLNGTYSLTASNFINLTVLEVYSDQQELYVMV